MLNMMEPAPKETSRALQPYILTLTLDETLTHRLNTLRQKYFPPKRNFLDAHVTLFHSLPAEQELMLRENLRMFCSGQPPFRVGLPELKHWGKGVFITLKSPELLAVRTALAEQWSDWLTTQDRQGYRPHVTIQNKVPREEAKLLHETLSASWQTLEGKALGLHLWRYEGGPWSSLERFTFSDMETP